MDVRLIVGEKEVESSRVACGGGLHLRNKLSNPLRLCFFRTGCWYFSIGLEAEVVARSAGSGLFAAVSWTGGSAQRAGFSMSGSRLLLYFGSVTEDQALAVIVEA